MSPFLNHLFAMGVVQGLRFSLQYVSGGPQEPVQVKETILIDHQDSDEPSRQKTEIKNYSNDGYCHHRFK
ncbi:MAG: hypothetical protein CVU51_07485 [Deltaproteobacteria bacterium HGW-Deltaproteobacteria-1]|jgi:hypothetical protein|nr:MAG: hypothetical protein CVU51_07485 [Deltaproteobacteria bacterium HGW-Deltaproteobacteria-1]